jgi:hypothetical protein
MSAANEFKSASRDPVNSVHITPTHTEHGWQKAKDIHGKERIVKQSQNVVLNSKKRTIIIPSDTVTPPGAFQGSTVYSDFPIPPQTHIFAKAVLELDVYNDSTAAIQPLPTAHLIDHIELIVGSSVQEYIGRNHIYLESSGFANTQEHSNLAPDLNESTSYGAVSLAAKSVNTGADEARLRIRIKTCLDSCSGLFIDGFTESIKFRVHYNSSGLTGGAASLKLQAAQMYLTEHILSDFEYQKQMKVHRNNAATYRCVVRNQQDASFAPLTSTSPNQITLSSLRGMTCALFVLVQSQNVKSASYDNVTSIQIKEGDGTKVTEIMSSRYMLGDVATEFNKDSAFWTTKAIYPIPFALHPLQSISTGVQSGYTHLSSRERVEVFAQAGSTGGKTVTILQYGYATIACVKGKFELQRT